MRNYAKVEVRPYYWSCLATLIAPNGRRYCLGELPRFVERVLGLDGTAFVCEVQQYKAKGIPNDVACAKVLLRHMREYNNFTRNRQVYAALDKQKPWEYYAQ